MNVELSVFPELFDISHIMELSLSMLQSIHLKHFSISLSICCISSTEKLVSFYREFLLHRTLCVFFYKKSLPGLSDSLKHLNLHTESHRKIEVERDL